MILPTLLPPETPLPRPSRRAADGREVVEKGDQVWLGDQQVSCNSDGTAADRPSGHPAISSTGRFTAFDSGATNLLWWRFYGASQVYRHDAETGNTCMCSIGDAGQQANADCTDADVSNDGRFVVFLTKADNLLPDRRFVPHVQVYLHDVEKHQTLLISHADNGALADADCIAADISEDGHHIRFATSAGNLAPGTVPGAPRVYDLENPLPDMAAARQRSRDTQRLQQALKSPPGTILDEGTHIQIGDLQVAVP